MMTFLERPMHPAGLSNWRRVTSDTDLKDTVRAPTPVNNGLVFDEVLNVCAREYMSFPARLINEI